MSSPSANLQIQSDHPIRVHAHRNNTTPIPFHRSLQHGPACGGTKSFEIEIRKTPKLDLGIEASERLHPFHTIPREPCRYLKSACPDNLQDCKAPLLPRP